MKNTHHHRDHTTTHRTPCIHFSNSASQQYSGLRCSNRYLWFAAGFDRCLLLFCYSLNVHSRDVHPCYLVPRCPLPRFQRPHRKLTSTTQPNSTQLT